MLFSFTTNLWTGCHSQADISITIHYLSPDDNYADPPSLCYYTTGLMSHNAENLANEIEEMPRKWNIRDKIYGTTSDNAQYIKNTIFYHMKLHHLGC